MVYKTILILLILGSCMTSKSQDAQSEVKHMAIGMDMQPLLKSLFSDGSTFSGTHFKMLRTKGDKYLELSLRPSLEHLNAEQTSNQDQTSFGLSASVQTGRHFEIQPKWLLGYGWTFDVDFNQTSSDQSNSNGFKRKATEFGAALGPVLDPTFKISNKIWLRTKMGLLLNYRSATNKLEFNGGFDDKQTTDATSLSIFPPRSIVLLYFIR